MKARTLPAIAVLTAVLLAVAGASLLVGYRIGVARAFLRDRRASQEPEPAAGRPAVWQQEEPPPQPPAAPPPPEKVAPPPSAPAAPRAPFALLLAEPVRITWPLDVGPDWGPDRPDRRVCLRARQGVNELQNPGEGKALYPFRVARAGRYVAYLRVRWVNDRVGSVDCNNSWFAGFDGLPAATVGNRGFGSAWHWERGPTAMLAAGVHWLRVELREDGPVADRAVIVPAAASLPPADLEKAAVLRHARFAGEAPPLDPQRPVGQLEISALPTGSLAIGKGHRNEVTVSLWWQGGGGEAGEGFSGRIEVECSTAAGLVVKGRPELRAGFSEPFVRRVLELGFPPGAARRPHQVVVSVRDANGKRVFRQELRFVKGPAWAFLGPFRGAGKSALPCDRKPRLLAGRKGLGELGLSAAPTAGKSGPARWKLVADGSCYDWTGAVDFGKVYGRTGPAFAYAVTWLAAQRDLRHRSFNFQADDSGWLWVNGSLITVAPVNLPLEASRLWSSARLAMGSNPVVVKLTQTGGYWRLRFDVVDWHWQGRRGDVVTGLEPAKWPK